jgi:TP901 family phage tail tape measure protein
MSINTEKVIVQVVVKGQKDISNLKTETKNFSKEAQGAEKQTQNLVVGFTKMAAKVGSAVIAFRTITKTVSMMVRDFRDFEFQMAKTAATTGATAEEFITLSKTAEDLGRTTFFTAQQVAELQTNFGKLGFTTKEILNAQEATLQLATATDTDLGRAAIVAGAAVRGFGLDASETQRVVDVMAVAFTSSALDIEKFQTSMTKVAPIAKSAGFSIEDTTAIMAQLSDSGIEASIAGTSLRNILLKMQDPNSDLVKSFGTTIHSLDQLIPALTKFTEEGGSLADIMEVVDLRQAAAFEQMITSRERTVALRDELNKARGAAEAMADIVGDNLEGAFKRLNSAISGLLINLTETFIGKSYQNFIDGLANIINLFSDLVDVPVSESLEKQRIELNILVGRLTDVNIQEEERNRIIGELNVKYPDFLKNIDTEKTTTAQLRDRLREVNGDLKNRILLQRESERVQKALTKADKDQNKEIDREEKLIARLTKVQEKYKIEIADGLTFEQQVNATIKELSKEFTEYGRLLDGRKNQAILLRQALAKLTIAQRKSKNSTNKHSEAVTKLTDLEKELGLVVEKTTQEQEEQTVVVKKGTQAIVDDTAARRKAAEDLDYEIRLYLDGIGQLSEAQSNDLAREIIDREIDDLRTLIDLGIQNNNVNVDKIGIMQQILKLEKQKNAIGKVTQDDNKVQLDQLDDLGKGLITLAGNDEDLQKVRQAGVKVSAAVALARNAETIATTGSALANDLAKGFPLNIPAVLSTLALIISIRQNMRALTSGGKLFEKGGIIETFADGGMVHGKSHAFGGEKFAVGGRVVELEGGEAVINKRSTAMFRSQLSAMNSAGGGVKFADGGLLNMPSFASNQFNAINNANMLSAMSSGSRVVVVESDITDAQNSVSVIESESKF